MKSFDKILIVDDDRDVLLAAQLFLKQHAERVDTEADPNRIPELLQNDSYDVILLDMNFAQDATSGREGFHWLRRILEIDPSAVVVLITAFGDVKTAVQAIKEGATDFVLKPWQNEKLLATLSAAATLRRSRLDVVRLRSRQRQLHADLDRQFPGIVAVSPVMRDVFETIRKVGATDANVLILGDNGTGKDAVAHALHRQSGRADQVFIQVDLGAVPETLFESELFGHKKGAFTDAREDRAGRFETASGGTLFLDEIGNLSLPLQAKLLTVLDKRTVFRLGTNKPVPIDIRLVCATNTPIHDLAARTNSARTCSTASTRLKSGCRRSGTAAKTCRSSSATSWTRIAGNTRSPASACIPAPWKNSRPIPGPATSANSSMPLNAPSS